MRFLKIHTTAALAAMVFAASVAAAQDVNLHNAEVNLQAAWDSLQATPYAYGGHRRKALEHIGKALEEIRKAEVEPFRGGKEEKEELKREKRERKLERKEEKREEKLERKEQQREEELEQRGH